MFARFVGPTVVLALLLNCASAETIPITGELAYEPFSLGAPVPDIRCGANETGSIGMALPITGTGRGAATYVGEFTESSDVTLCLDNGHSFGTYAWELADGDSLYFSFVGQELGRSNDNDSDLALYESTILGGTGRFSGAAGVLYTDQVRPDSGGAFNTFHGAIALGVPEPPASSLILTMACGLVGIRRRF